MAAKEKTKPLAPEKSPRILGGVVLFMILTLVFDAEVAWHYWFQ